MTSSTTARQYEASIADEARNGSNVLVPLDADADGWEGDMQLSQKRPGGEGNWKENVKQRRILYM